MTIRDEELDLRGIKVQVSALEVDGTDISASDLSDIADLVGNLTATAEEIDAAAALADAITATAAEINKLDASDQTEVITQGGTVSATKRHTVLTQTTTGAITLAAPGADMHGVVKIIEQVDGGTDAVTLALTNVVGGSQATTATFDATGERLVLVGATGKWIVLKELGVTLS